MSYRKHLLNFDASRRTSTTIKTYSAKYEQLPFNGMVADAAFVSDQISTAQPVANWNCSTYRIDKNSLATAISDANTTAVRKYSEMYLITKTTVVSGYALFDWWGEDRDTFVWNTGTIAGYFVSAARWRGVFFDPEPSNTAGLHLWKYSDRPFASSKTLQEYKDRVRETGRWVMEAWIAEGVKNVYIAFGYEQVIKEPLVAEADRRYGLYGAFLDGLFDAAHGKCTIKNYYEDGYNHVDQADIDHGTEQQRDNPGQGVAETKRLSYLPSYASYIDNLGAADITDALVRAHNTAIEDDQWVYANAQPFHGASGTPGVTDAEIAAVLAARIQLGYERTFSPANWAGLIADFNPNLMAGLGYADSDPITSYTDSTGIVYTQSGGNRPLYKTNGIAAGKPGVLFTKASSQNLVADTLATRLQNALTSDIPFTIVFVAKATATGAIEYMFGIGRDATTNPEFSFGQTNTNVHRFVIHEDGAGNAVANGTATTDTAAHVYSLVYSGTVLNMRVDGTNVLATTPYVTLDYGAMTFNQARLGSSAKNSIGNYFGGTIGRFVAYNRCHGLQVVRDLEYRLGLEAGIATAGA